MAPRTRSSARAGIVVSAAEGDPTSEAPVTTIPSESDGSPTTSTEIPRPEVTKTVTRKRPHEDDQSSEAPVQPAAKRVRGKQGKLKGVMNMPIEVFTEIARYLYPLDLILLARANKFFRQLLMCRSAIQTWQHALSNMPGLPPCPEDLCEPHYAALVFSKYCSACGSQVLRSMDPVLLVRFCVPCRKKHAMIHDGSNYDIIPKSHTLVPQKGRRREWWCLRKDVMTFRRELNQLCTSNGQAARWKEIQRRNVETRQTNARVLAEFLNQMEAEQNEDLEIRKGQREEEIRSRLLNLGWQEIDFEMREKDAIKQWKSLVCVAKPFVERGWEKLYEQLKQLLEHNIELRLQEEALARHEKRKRRTQNWLSNTLKRWDPYARSVNNAGFHITHTDDSPAAEATTTEAHLQLQSPGAKSEKPTRSNSVLKTPYPCSLHFMTLKPFRCLIDTDQTMPDFEIALAGMRPVVGDALLEWRLPMEQRLFKILPSSAAEATASRGLASSTTEIPEITTLVNGQPLTDLPTETQRILRADTVFTHRGNDISFYPDNFTELGHSQTPSKWKYNTKASKIARALSVALGCSGATYLQMKTIGPALSCGRCNTRKCVTWCQLIEHYAGEAGSWETVQNHTLFQNGQLPYLFTHGLDMSLDDKPLVRMANGEDKKTPFKSSYGRYYCLFCRQINGRSFHSDIEVVDHLQIVHSIRSPKLNKQYKVY